ncbi:transposase IS4 family protein, partial [mine drainage metagenome]
GWVFDHSEGRSVYGMQYATAVISGIEGIFPLNLDLKTKKGPSKIVMQIAVMKRAITAGLEFSTVVFDSWYFASRLILFLEREKKDWVTEAKSNRKIYVDGRWVRLKDYADSLNIRDMTAYSIDGESYFMKSITTGMRNVGKVQVIVSRGLNSEKFFVTNRIDWKPRKVIDQYLRRWDIEVFHRELKQDGLGHLYQRTHESLLGTAKLSPLGALLLEISAIRSLESHLKIGKGTPGLRFRSIAMRVLVDLLKAMENHGKEFLDALLESIRKPYKSTMGVMGGQIAKL